MDFRIKLMGTVVAGGAILGGAGWGLSSGDDRPLQGSSRDRATEAALDHLGGGTVIETEQGDGGATYEVEVRVASGAVVEVLLDENHAVIGTEADDVGEENGENDDDAGADD